MEGSRAVAFSLSSSGDRGTCAMRSSCCHTRTHRCFGTARSGRTGVSYCRLLHCNPFAMFLIFVVVVVTLGTLEESRRWIKKYFEQNDIFINKMRWWCFPRLNRMQEPKINKQLFHNNHLRVIVQTRIAGSNRCRKKSVLSTKLAACEINLRSICFS